MKMDGYLKIGIPSAPVLSKFLKCEQYRIPFLWKSLNLRMPPFNNILFLKIKVWSLGKTKKNYSPPPKTTTVLNTHSSPYKNREVVGTEAFKTEISAHETVLLFAQRCKSMYFIL